jgi:hypothetical protein
MMRRSIFIGFFLLGQVVCNNAPGQQFTAGRLVVERVGNGSPQSGAGTQIFLDEYSTTGVPGVSIALPTVTNPPVNRTVESGIYSSDGMISRSVDGKSLVVPGYDAAPGTPAVVSALADKVITLVNANGSLASTVLTDATTFSGNNFRSVVTTDGSEYWLSGAGNGPIYVMHQGSTTAVAGTEISTTSTDNRNLFIFNSELYQGTGFGPVTGIDHVGSGLPMVAGNIMTTDVNMGAIGDPYSFVILNNGMPVMYVADFANKLIRKYYQVAGTWFTAGSVTVTVGGTATGFYGITGNVAGGLVHLYATTTNASGSNSRIVSFTDATTSSTIIAGSVVSTTIAGPTLNTAFHGIAFVPFSVSGISSAASSLCVGSGTTITISGNPNTVVNYLKNGIAQPPVTIPSTGTYTINTGALAANTTYMVTGATDGNIAQTYAYSATILVNPLPAISSGGATSICNGASAGLTASGGLTYTWAPATGLSSTIGNSVTASPSSTTTYVITGTDINGCSNTATATVTIRPLPPIRTGPSVAICIGSSAGLGVTGGASYTWAPAAGLSSTIGGAVTANPTTTTSYTVTGIDINGCSATATTTVSVNMLPTVNAGADVAICTGSSAVLTATGAAHYLWWPGTALSTRIGASVIASPTSATSYTVTGTDANGCTNWASVNVTVNSIPTVSAGTNADICLGASTALTAAGAADYLWTPGAGLAVTTGGNVIANPATTTTYTVTGTDANGCKNWAPVTVTVHANPFVVGTGGGICPGSSVAIFGHGALSYTWAPNTGLSSAIGGMVMANPSATTNYTVTGTSSYGCTNSALVTVTVYPVPPVSAGANVAICSGSSTVLTASGANNYSWAPGAGLAVTVGNSILVHPAVTTTYTVTGLNICYNQATVTVTVNPLPTIVGSTSSICSGSSTTIATGGAATYTWVPGTGLSATTGSSVTANPTANSIYVITGTDVNGCVSRATATVRVNLLPTVRTGRNTTICDGSSSLLIATGANTYAWTPGTGLSANTGSNVTATPSTTTTYTVTGTNIYGCTDQATVSVSVNPRPAAYTVTGGGTFCSVGSGVPVGLTGSEAGISYKLYRGTLYTGISRIGSGSSLDFGMQISAGFYTVVAQNLTTGCSAVMTGGVTVTIIPSPLLVTVTGGGNYCVGGAGVPVGITASVTGVDYQLYRNGIAVDSPIGGRGFGFNFGLYTDTGTYTVIAAHHGSTCSTNMYGSAAINTLAPPAIFSVTGGGAYCEGGTGVHIGLIGSQIGAHYQLYLGPTAVGHSIIGLGTPLDFGSYTAQGVYIVHATNSITGCNDSMTGTATVTINPTPVITGKNIISRHDTVTYLATQPGGTWTSREPFIATIGASTGLVTGIIVATTVVTYTLPTGCSDTHPVTVAPNVGVNDINQMADFALIPNPNNGTFILKGTLTNQTDREVIIEVMNTVGQVIYNSKITATGNELSEHIALGDVPAGMYILSLKAGTEKKLIRFVKE